MFEKSYARYWAKDVVTEMDHDDRDELAVDWVLRWMARNWYEPEQESVTSMSDAMSAEFQTYITKRNLAPDQADRATASAQSAGVVQYALPLI